MKAWIDEKLGGITMYRSALYGLSVISVAAFVLMVVGVISILSPLHFVLAIIVSVGVSYGANRLFGWLFSVRPHAESALITGLILALLFTPPETALGFAKLGLVAAIAMASKYVLAPRGRHIFNPAAIAIVIASVGGLAYAGWWVSTSVMVPVIAAVALLLLYKTKKIRLGLVFIVASLIALGLHGVSPVDALLYWPILFVAGVMLSEPLTLPPRAWQQYAVAVLVAVLMAQPFNYSVISMTPALALVLGNVVGWWFGQRGRIKLRFAGKKQLSDSAYEFRFDVTKLGFEPGQYIELTLPHAGVDSRGTRRVFSIVGMPGDEQISIGTKIPSKPSSFKRALMNLKAGTVVDATRVAGDFVLPEEDKTPVVLIAGGIGVTPYVSFALSAGRPLQLIYAVGKVSELSFVEQLRHHNVDVTVVTKDDSRLPDPEWRRAQGSLNTDTLGRLIDVSENPTVYVSGPPAMVVSVSATVRSLGVKNVKVDEFSGY